MRNFCKLSHEGRKLRKARAALRWKVEETGRGRGSVFSWRGKGPGIISPTC